MAQPPDNQGINFLDVSQLDKTKLKEKLLTAAKKAAVVLVLWLLALSSVIGYNLILKSKSDSLRKDVQELNQQLLVLNDKITLILVLKDRLGRIKDVLANRDDFGQPLENFFSSVPGGITLAKVSLNSNVLNITGTGDILSISQLAKNYTSQAQDWYQGATLRSLVKNEKDTRFNFNLVISL